MNISLVYFFLGLSTFEPTIDIIQNEADFISVVNISSTIIEGENYFKASPVHQIRGKNYTSFRLWLEGNSIVSDGQYVIFYNLCENIGYPVLKEDGIFEVKNGTITVVVGSNRKNIMVKSLKNWLSKNGMFQDIFFHECLAGRKGLPMTERAEAPGSQL